MSDDAATLEMRRWSGGNTFVGTSRHAVLPIANPKVKFIWVVVVLALLMGFRATQPVLYFEQCVDCTTPPHPAN